MAPVVDENVAASPDRGGSHVRSRRLRLPSADLLYALIAALALGLFCVAIPPGWGWDEQSHVGRAYQVSEGVLIPLAHTHDARLSAMLPDSLVDLEMDGHRAANAVERGAPWWQRADAASSNAAALWRAPLSTVTQDYDISNAAASTFVAYAPAAAGLALGRLFGLDTGGVLLLGKIVNALVYLLLTWAAVRLLRGHRVRWLFFVVALLPGAITQAAYVTADTYTNAISLLFVALVLRLHLSGTAPSWRILGGTALAGIGVVMAKPSYALLLALLLTVPWRRVLPAAWVSPDARRSGLRGAGLVGGYLAVSALLTLAVLRLTASAAPAIAAMYDRGADPVAQTQAIVAQPFEAVAVLVRSVVYYGEVWLKSLLGAVGYNAVDVPQPFALLCIVLLVLAALVGERIRPLAGGAWIVVAAVTGWVAIMAIYVSFSSLGAPAADGVQGRYFIPLLIPLLIGCRTLLPMRATLSDRAATVLFPVGSAAVLASVTVLWSLTLH